MPFPYTFTFYSYKGGVGRSLALLNTAYVLSSWGRHVLIVDMDLEAPGVGGLLTRLGELSPQPEIDLLDLLSQARTNTADELPPVSTFIRSVLPEKLAPLKPKLGESGRIDVLAPDMDRNFTDRLANLGIKDLNREEIINLGQILHTYFKRQRFQHRPLGIEDFEDPIQTPYDYILVDSRTGLTEIGGLCVGPLADRLVVLSGLNDQNITGTKTFLNEVGIEPKRRSNEDVWDDADPRENRDEIPSLGPKPTIVVATPVPMGEIEFKRERLSVLQNAIGIKPLLVSYHPRLALMETIFVRDFIDEPPTADYIRLADRITSQVEDSADQLARLANQGGALRSIDGPQALRLLAQRPEMAPLVYFFSTSSLKLEASLKIRIMATLAEDTANRAGMLSNWAVVSTELAKGTTSDLRTKLLEAASKRCSEATRLKPDFAAAFSNWGDSLSDLAKTKRPEHSDHLFAQAFEKYSEATRIEPDSAEAFSHWGVALSEFAKTKPPEQADHLFAEAFEKYSEATRLKPDFDKAFNNWGNALSALARIKPREQADRLFAQAFEKYSEATRLKPDRAEAFSNWGAALSNFAKTIPPEQADHLFAEAFEKYSEATRLKPDFAGAFSNWGDALSNSAARATPPKQNQLYSQAREKLQLAGESGLFNLACLEARQGNVSAAINNLKEFAKAGQPLTAETIDADSDFDAIRHDHNFADFVAQLRQNTNPK